LATGLLADHLETPAVLANIMTETTTEETAVIARRITEVMKDNLDERIPLMNTLAGLVQRIEIEPGKIKVAICESALAELLGVERERISDDFLEVESAFQHRKRGVETKLTLANETHPRDETLIKNLAKAHRYFEQIRSGQTYAEIAATEGVSKHRIQKLLDLAFLAPDVVRDAFVGAQPPGLTTERLLRNAIPSSWEQQRDLFRTF
jgi:site-specific DNA recombinase